jgi:hypothetical protein
MCSLFYRSAPKLSCIEEFEEEDYDDCFPTPESQKVPVLPTVYINHMPQTSSIPTTSNSQQVPSVMVSSQRSPPSSFVSPSAGEDKENASDLTEMLISEPAIQRHPKSPVEHRKSYAHAPSHVTSHPEGSRRPHTVPMDAKLNLPYMTGYDKVMHLLDMPTSGDSRPLMLDGEDEDFFPGSNSSDPVASSPGSDASESVVDSCCEDEFGKHLPRRRGSTDRRKAVDDSPGEEEINDNVSDESGYSEEANNGASLRRSSESSSVDNNNEAYTTDLSLNLDPRGSPILKKKSSTNHIKNSSFGTSTTTIIIKGTDEPVENNKSHMKENKSSCPTTLVVYDNLSFEI